MSKESIAEESKYIWQDKLYYWSPCRLGVAACFLAFLYGLYQLIIVGGNGGERSIEIIAYFVFAAILASVDLLLKWLFNLTPIALWVLELLIIAGMVFLYLN